MIILIHQEPNRNKRLRVARGIMREETHLCLLPPAGISCSSTFLLHNVPQICLWCERRACWWIVRCAGETTEGGFTAAPVSIFALEWWVFFCRSTWRTLHRMLITFPPLLPVTSPLKLWCESYLTAAASDCEGGRAVHTSSRSLSRVFFMHFRSSSELMGAVRHALPRIMTRKWVEIVNSISNERRPRDMMRWGKSFVTTEWCCLIPRGKLWVKCPLKWGWSYVCAFQPVIGTMQ